MYIILFFLILCKFYAGSRGLACTVSWKLSILYCISDYILIINYVASVGDVRVCSVASANVV